jgi:hypothetical protein
MPDWIGDQMAGVGPEATRGLRPECANTGRSYARWQRLNSTRSTRSRGAL